MAINVFLLALINMYLSIPFPGEHLTINDNNKSKDSFPKPDVGSVENISEISDKNLNSDQDDIKSLYNQLSYLRKSDKNMAFSEKESLETIEDLLDSVESRYRYILKDDIYGKEKVIEELKDFENEIQNYEFSEFGILDDMSSIKGSSLNLNDSEKSQDFEILDKTEVESDIILDQLFNNSKSEENILGK